MKASILASVVFLEFACAYPSEARIGETPDKCKTRYGDPFSETTNAMFFAKNSYLIMTGFFDGKVDEISFKKVDDEKNAQAELSDNEIETLLKANGGERTWIRPKGFSVDRQWQTEDHQLVASYATFEKFLFIMTMDHYKRGQAEKAKDEKKKLSGF